MGEIRFPKLRNYGKIMICIVFICIGLCINGHAAHKVCLRYDIAGGFIVQGYIEADEWDYSNHIKDRVLGQGSAYVAYLLNLYVQPKNATGETKYTIQGFQKIGDDFLAIISHHNNEKGEHVVVFVHGLRSPGKLLFRQSVEVRRGNSKIEPLTELNFSVGGISPYKIDVNIKELPYIHLYFKYVEPNQGLETSHFKEALEKWPSDELRPETEVKKIEKPRRLPMENVNHIPNVDSWRKNLLFRFYNNKGTVEAEEIWKDVTQPFKISNAHKNKKVILTTPAGSVDCRPDNGLIQWANCSKELFIENTKDTDILFLLYNTYGTDQTFVYRILNGDKGTTKTRISVPKLADGNSSEWLVQSINRENGVEFYEQKLDMNNNTKLYRSEITLTVHTIPGSVVLATDRGFTYTQLVQENGKVTFQFPNSTDYVDLRIRKPGYFAFKKSYSFPPDDRTFALKIPLKKIPQTKFQKLKKRGSENLEKFGGSLSDLKVIVKDLYGKLLLIESFNKVHTPLPANSNRLELIDEKGKLIFKGNRLQKSIDLSPSSKKVDLYICLENGLTLSTKNGLTLLIKGKPNPLIAADKFKDHKSYSLYDLELAINGAAYKPITAAYLCSNDFAPFQIADLSPDPKEDFITIDVKLESRKPKVLIALSEYSTSDAYYYAVARDILKIDLAEKLRRRKAIVGILKKDGFQEIKKWGTEKPSFYGDTADVIKDLQRASILIYGQEDICGQTLPGRIIYIGGDPGIKKVPEDFPDFYVISHQKRKSYPGAPGVPEKNWYQERDKAGILRTLESLL